MAKPGYERRELAKVKHVSEPLGAATAKWGSAQYGGGIAAKRFETHGNAKVKHGADLLGKAMAYH